MAAAPRPLVRVLQLPKGFVLFEEELKVGVIAQTQLVRITCPGAFLVTRQAPRAIFHYYQPELYLSDVSICSVPAPSWWERRAEIAHEMTQWLEPGKQKN